jgi:ParB family transcriptional regulator, chromosome partitioning protein
MAIVPDEQVVPLEALGQELRHLRLATEDALRHMRRSLEHHGQLTALAAYRIADGALEIIDGFKRVQVAQELGLNELRVRVVATSTVKAKLAITVLNESQALTELEEAWLVRSLYRQDGLSQPEIGRLLGRHKSWVCRRLILVEALDEAVQADVRLGLLGSTLARALARLPRGNQRLAADVVIRRGMTTRQTETLVADVLGAEERRRDLLLQDMLTSNGELSAAPARRCGHTRTAAEWIVTDVATLTRLCGRLQARLLGQPLLALGDPGAQLVIEALRGLKPLLRTLDQQIDQVQQTGQGAMDVKLEQSRGARAPDGDAVPPGAVPAGDSAGAEHQPQHRAQDPDAACLPP